MKVNKSDLPESAQVVAEVIGVSATLKLASKCQYRHCSVPKSPLKDDHWIVRVIGPKKALELQSVFGGELIPLATCYRVAAKERNERIKAAYSMGTQPVQIAQEFDVSLDTVRRAINPKMAEVNRQRTLERYHERKTQNGGEA